MCALGALKWLLPARDILGANGKSPQRPGFPSCLTLQNFALWERSHRPRWSRLGEEERMWDETVREVRTEVVSGITKTIASIPEQNSVT